MPIYLTILQGDLPSECLKIIRDHGAPFEGDKCEDASPNDQIVARLFPVYYTRPLRLFPETERRI